MRLRTLPLSLSGVIAGTALASKLTALSLPLVLALFLTTIFLQILSNLSNELGDALHGTDTAERQGIRYSIQDGEITVTQMKVMIAIMACLCCISGIVMVLFSFGTLLDFRSAGLIVLGAAAIWAAMHYTLGKNPYGYRGLGDISVFIFFGLVSVLGAGYVCSHSILPEWILPASAIGCWSVAVLNVNNIRDMKTDAATRTTVALRLGLKKARIYQTVLIAGGWLIMTVYALITASGWLQWLFFLPILLFAMHIHGVWTKTDRQLDPMLPLLVMSTFATAILFALCL